ITGDFKKGNITAVHSELALRMQIIEYQIDQNYSKTRLIKSLGFYLQTFQFLYKYGTLSEVWREFDHLEEILEKNRTYHLWKSKLLIFLLIYKMTGKEYQLQNHLFKLKQIAKFVLE